MSSKRQSTKNMSEETEDTFTLAENPNIDDCICRICASVMRKPKLIIGCDHSFCSDCIDQLIRKSNSLVRCPIDKIPFNPSSVLSVVSDKVRAQAVSDLRVYCSHRDKGCDVISELKNMQAHSKKCVYGLDDGEKEWTRMVIKELRSSISSLRTEVRHNEAERKRESEETKEAIDKIVTDARRAIKQLREEVSELKGRNAKLEEVVKVLSPSAAEGLQITGKKSAARDKKTNPDQDASVAQNCLNAKTPKSVEQEKMNNPKKKPVIAAQSSKQEATTVGQNKKKKSDASSLETVSNNQNSKAVESGSKTSQKPCNTEKKPSIGPIHHDVARMNKNQKTAECHYPSLQQKPKANKTPAIPSQTNSQRPVGQDRKKRTNLKDPPGFNYDSDSFNYDDDYFEVVDPELWHQLNLGGSDPSGRIVEVKGKKYVPTGQEQKFWKKRHGQVFKI